MNNHSLIAELYKLKASARDCEKIFCTTCGGIASSIERNMTLEIERKLDKYLENVSFDEFFELKGEWCELIKQLKPRMVDAMFFRKIEAMDPLNIRELDALLIKARRLFRESPEYQYCFQVGLKKALETQDESLIESIVILLGENILQYKELFSIAMERMHTNRGIHRALYNAVRETVPEVRGYVGDGNTVRWW